MESWTLEKILDAADAEVGPSCCDEEYIRLRTIMGASTDLLEALERFREAFVIAVGDKSPFAKCALSEVDAAISKARGSQ